MPGDKPRSAGKRQIAEARRRRAAEALRTNLLRRKDQHRARMSDQEVAAKTPKNNHK